MRAKRMQAVRRRAAVRLAALGLAMAIAASCAPGRVKAVDKTIAYKIDELPAAYRLVGPRYLYEPEAAFTIWVPPREAERKHVLVITKPDGEAVERSVRLRKAEAKAKPEVHTAVMAADMADWPDGAYGAELRLEGAGPRAKPRAECAFRIVRQAVEEAWQGGLRDEAAVWLRHANRPRDIWKKVPHWHNLDRAMAEPSLLYDGLRGLVLRSYWNPQLQRLQPYGLYVPQAYDPKKKIPLMILLHGSGGDYLNLVSDIYEGQELESNPMLVANAGAFKSQEYRHMALNDVLWVIEDMARKYTVDPDRVYLQGISLGGRGALEMMALRPDVFAAASPQGVYGCFQEPNDVPDFLRMDEWARWSVARWDLRSYLPNLRGLPIQIIYGHHDKTTPPVNALTFKTLANKRFGARIEVLGFDADHNISTPVYDWADTRAWLLKHRRTENPHVVTARTASLRFNRFHWVTIDAMGVQWQMADVEARYDPKSHTLTVTTENVSRLTLEPPGVVKALSVDGQAAPLPKGKRAERFALERGAKGTWALADADAAPQRGVKRHGQSGPVWDVCHGRCLAVYGTGGTQEETAHLEKMARHIARLDAAWGEASWPVLADTEVTDEQKATCNLLLVGDARTNALLRGGKWPFDLKAIGEGRGISVMDEAYGDPCDVLCFIYPSPFADEGYVYVVAPSRPTAGKAMGMNPSTGWQVGEWCDWLVARHGEKGEGDHPYLADGVFDSRWRLQPMPGRSVRPRYMNWEKD